MTGLIITLVLVLLVIVIVQISRINELAKGIRGEEETLIKSSNRQGLLLFLFMIVFLVLVIGSAIYYKNYMLGYGPHEAASEHGPTLDRLFNVTLLVTGIVFFITQIALFYFAYKYRYNAKRKATFMAHDNKLEMVWTAIPAFAMFVLVIMGLVAWNDVMADVDPNEEYIEMEATGMQFSWIIRYPGPDGALGARNFKLINGLNQLGQDWTDTKNLDDFQPSEIVLPKGKKVRVRITSRDVLHNFYLPHFRLKMDAVPGMPTYFVFTPSKTTEEYREELSKYKEYQVAADPTDPESPMKWESFNYELACAELCGSGHYSMRKVVRIVEQGEYESWLRSQKSFYFNTVRGTDQDPYKDQLFDPEIEERKAEFNDALQSALDAAEGDDRIVELKYVFFETGSDQLTLLSRFELDNVVDAMVERPNLVVELGGHTDNTGSEETNLTVSQNRAESVKTYLVENGIEADRVNTRGYGQSAPVDTNDTEEGRAKNRRTELKIIRY